MPASLIDLGSFLRRASTESASDFEIQGQLKTILTGKRDLVYLLALPDWCFTKRCSRLLVIPTYKELSEQRSI